MVSVTDSYRQWGCEYDRDRGREIFNSFHNPHPHLSKWICWKYIFQDDGAFYTPKLDLLPWLVLAHMESRNSSHIKLHTRQWIWLPLPRRWYFCLPILDSWIWWITQNVLNQFWQNFGRMRQGQGKNPIISGGNPDPGAEPGFKKYIFLHIVIVLFFT